MPGSRNDRFHRTASLIPLGDLLCMDRREFFKFVFVM
jgi:hypothetical protein